MIRYLLVAPKWLIAKGAKKSITGYFTDEFIEQKNSEGYSVFYYPNGTAKKIENRALKGADITEFNYIFVDMDLKDKVYESKEQFLEKVLEFPIEPSLTVESGHGMHIYWKITNLDREAYCYLQMSLINHFKTDSSLWTVLQLMRLPGSLNTKEESNFISVNIIEDLSQGNSYTVEQFLEHLQEPTEDQIKKIQRHIDKIEGRVSEDYLDISAELPDKFLKLLEENEEIRILFEEPLSVSGDRSCADMSLANRLYSLGFSKQDTLSVIMNTLKGRERTDPQGYAEMTVGKVYIDRNKYYVEPLSSYQHKDFSKNLGIPVSGCVYWDRLTKPWRTKEVLTIISPSGCGKTAITLNNFKAMIDNNSNKNHIFVFFSLEMSVSEILDRWIDLTGNSTKYKDRLYVVANEDDEGNPRYLNLQDIYLYCKGIEKSTGKKILSIAIDHLDAINSSIDLKINPNFRAEGKECEYRGKTKVSLKKGELCMILRDMCKELDIFIILQSQTSKEKSGLGDLPLNRTAAFGTSKVEWYSNYIITLWKPLLRVQDKTELRLVGWKYAKIREQRTTDDIEENTQYLLKFDQTTGDYESIKSNLEKEEIAHLLQECDEARRKESKKEFTNYKFSPKEIKSLLRKKFDEKGLDNKP